MRLVETTSKDVLLRYGLRSPERRLCSTAEEASVAAGELGCPVYVKAQIPFGDRATLGLVKRVDDAATAGAEAARILSQAVDGIPVDSVLVEKSVEPRSSAYLSVHVDGESAARVLRIGLGGGAGYDPTRAEVQVPVPLAGLETYEIRRLLGQAGVTGSDREALTSSAVAIIRAAREWHAYTVEVNPVFITAEGPVAIDAKLELDDYSLKTVPDRQLIGRRAESEREAQARQYQEKDYRGSFKYVQLIDESEVRAAGGPRIVGSHSVGGGESLVVFDALDAVGVKPANYCDTSGAPSREKVAFAAQLIAEQPHIDAYFFSSCIANQPLSITAAGLVDGFRAANWRGPTVVRIAGNQEPEARAIVEAWVAESGAPARVVGREVDEWQAAQLLNEVLAEVTV